MNKNYSITANGKKELEKELELLKARRGEIADKIAEARDFGDLSENAEYDQAKNEQAQVEEKIAKLENMIRNSIVIDEENKDKDVVNIGSVVKVKEVGTNYEETYSIVGSAETDPLEGKISNESPVGRALLGKKVGEIADVEIPDGVLKFEIVSITI